MWYHHDWGWGMGGLGWLGMLLFWALVVLGIIYLVRALLAGQQGGDASRPKSDTDKALDILRERYAKGEIEQEEFEQRKRGLTH